MKDAEGQGKPSASFVSYQPQMDGEMIDGIIARD